MPGGKNGIREGPFAECKEELRWHFAAVLLLATILGDLEEEEEDDGGGGYFATLFGKTQIAALERRLEGLAVEATNYARTRIRAHISHC